MHDHISVRLVKDLQCGHLELRNSDYPCDGLSLLLVTARVYLTFRTIVIRELTLGTLPYLTLILVTLPSKATIVLP